MNKQAPVNARDWTADQTVEAVREQSRQFTQQEADYSQTGGDETKRCDLCFFWQGSGRCQVVGGEINAAGLSELYINKEQQDAAMDEDEDMSKSNGKRETKAFSVGECKVLDEAQGIVEHLVAVMGNVDLGDDVIHQGAFTKTITERGRKVKVVDSHNYNSAMDAIGVPLALWEVDRSELPPEVLLEFPTATGGLMAKTQFLMDTEMGSEIFKRIKAGAIDQYSIGYDALDIDFSKVTVDSQERTVRNLRTIKLYEYSPVVFAMNEATATLNAKDEPGDKNDSPEELDDKPDEDKAGRMLSSANANQVINAVVSLAEVLERAGYAVPGFDRAAVESDEEEKACLGTSGVTINVESNKQLAQILKELPGCASITINGLMPAMTVAQAIKERTITVAAVSPDCKVDIDPPAPEKVTEYICDKCFNESLGDVEVAEFPSGVARTFDCEMCGKVKATHHLVKGIPAPETQVADNEHQAGPQSAPTSNEDVLTQIKLYEAQLNLMEV